MPWFISTKETRTPHEFINNPLRRLVLERGRQLPHEMKSVSLPFKIWMCQRWHIKMWTQFKGYTCCSNFPNKSLGNHRTRTLSSISSLFVTSSHCFTMEVFRIHPQQRVPACNTDRWGERWVPPRSMAEDSRMPACSTTHGWKMASTGH